MAKQAMKINSNSRVMRDKAARPVTRTTERKMALSLGTPSTSKGKPSEIDSTVPVKTETAGLPQAEQGGTGMSVRWRKYVAKMDASEAFTNDLVVTMDANDISKRGSFIIMLDLKNILPAELIAELPKPDSEGGNNPDKYPLEDGGKRKGSFYNDLFDHTAKGTEIIYQLDEIALASNTKTFDRAHEKFKSMAADAMAKLEAKLKQRRNYGRTVLKQAASLILKLQEIEDGLPNMQVGYPSTSDDDLADTPRPFILSEKANPMQFKALTAPELLSINVEKANAKVPGGSKVAVLETMGKERRKPGGKASDEGEEGVKVTPDTFEDTAIALAEFISSIDEDKKLLGRLYAKLNGREGEGLLLALFQLSDAIDPIVSKPELQKRRLALEAEYGAREERHAS